MTTTLRKASPTRITTEPLFEDVVTDTTSSWHAVDNVTELFQAPEECLVFSYSTIMFVNNPEDFVSYEIHQCFNDFVNEYFLSLCFLISVPTNVINMAAFWKRDIKERINLCFECLSPILSLYCFFKYLFCYYYFLMCADNILHSDFRHGLRWNCGEEIRQKQNPLFASRL